MWNSFTPWYFSLIHSFCDYFNRLLKTGSVDIVIFYHHQILALIAEKSCIINRNYRKWILCCLAFVVSRIVVIFVSKTYTVRVEDSFYWSILVMYTFKYSKCTSTTSVFELHHLSLTIKILDHSECIGLLVECKQTYKRKTIAIDGTFILFAFYVFFMF